MNLILQPDSTGPLRWTNDWPPRFKGWRLPGGSINSTSGDFGTCCIQQLVHPQFSIHFIVIDNKDHLEAYISSQQHSLAAWIVLKGEIQLVSEKSVMVVKQNQCCYFRNPSCPATISLHPGTHFIIQVEWEHSFWNNQLLQAGMPDAFQPGKAAIQFAATIEILDIIQSILHCRYHKELLQLFLLNRASDLLGSFAFLLSDTQQEKQNTVTEAEREAISKAVELIRQDLTKHMPIPALSKQVGLNEFRFKQVFKYITGKAPYEFLVHHRMLQAKELIQQGEPIKSVAIMVGYRSSEFIRAFRKIFGYPPGTLKKK